MINKVQRYPFFLKNIDTIALHTPHKTLPMMMDADYENLIRKIYAGFNARDIDHVFTSLHPDVHWPKAFEGGYVVGHDAVRAYWTRQWSEINPRVEPVAITQRPDGKLEVLVHQLVKDLQGNVVFDGNVKHIYGIEGDLIRSMDVEM